MAPIPRRGRSTDASAKDIALYLFAMLIFRCAVCENAVNGDEPMSIEASDAEIIDFLQVLAPLLRVPLEI
jgi:hypothetical protein